MWIRIQNKEALVYANNFYIMKTRVEEKYEISYFDGDSFVKLGFYKSKERALEVLDEIQNLLIPKVILNTYNVENKETAYSKELVIEPIINDIKVQNNVNIVYQMPEE